MSRRLHGLCRLLMAALAVVLLGPAATALAVIQPGEPAPRLRLPDLAGRQHVIDGSTTDSLLMVFVKPDDHHTSAALAELGKMFTQWPQLGTGVRRLVVLSRVGDQLEPARRALAAHPGWTVLVDREDRAYRDYRMIATPTVVLVGPDRKVVAVHAGYDPGLIQDVRLELARLLGVELPATATGAPPPFSMELQLGRRMAARGLWERALHYYERAAEAGPLPPSARVELAVILIELERLDEAEALLTELGSKAPGAAAAARRLERARAASPPPPPPVSR